MSITLGSHLKRKGASPPVSAWNLRFLTGQLALFRLKWQEPDANAFRLID